MTHEDTMAVYTLDASGLRCPQPILKIAVVSADLMPGDLLDVIADCPTFDKDIRTWCRRLGKSLLSIQEEGEYRKKVRILF